MAKKKYYAVRVGLKTGIFSTWAECEASAKGYPGAEYKSFLTEAEALLYLAVADGAGKTPAPGAGSNGTCYAFVDGSYNSASNVYGAGGFLVDASGKKHVIQASGDDPEMAAMHNVAGEVLGAQLAIEKAIGLGMKELTVYFDYQGIASWADGSWKRTKAGTKAYYGFCQEAKKKIALKFVKVKGHSGIEGNEEADRLAKEAAGI